MQVGKHVGATWWFGIGTCPLYSDPCWRHRAWMTTDRSRLSKRASRAKHPVDFLVDGRDGEDLAHLAANAPLSSVQTGHSSRKCLDYKPCSVKKGSNSCRQHDSRALIGLPFICGRNIETKVDVITALERSSEPGEPGPFSHSQLSAMGVRAQQPLEPLSLPQRQIIKSESGLVER